MFAAKALAPDGSTVDGFAFDGALSVTYTGDAPVDAGIRVEVEVPATDDPQWLVPGVFYGENRPEQCTRIYPRFVRGCKDVERMESDTWSFHAGRLRERRGADDVRGEPARRVRRGLLAPRRPARDLARLPLPRGAAPLRRLGDACAARYPDVPLDAGRDDRARVRAERRRLAARAPTSQQSVAKFRLGERGGGRRARRVGSVPLALPPRSAAPRRDRGVRPRR